jgi:outer membrane protein OmpU
MNNLKKIGLSALAGSLVAISANAAELSVSGSVEVTYTDTGGTQGNELTGNSFGAKSDMSFSGSGDVGFGTVSMNRALTDTGAITTSYQTLDMGDMGVFSFDSKAGALVGITANDDAGMPTAYEEVWTGVGGDGVTGVGSTNVIGYRNTFSGVSISAGYTNAKGAGQTGESASSGTADTTNGNSANGHGSVSDIYASMSPAEGITIGAGYAVDGSTDDSTEDSDTKEKLLNIKYSMGPVSAGVKMSRMSNGTKDGQDENTEGASIAFNVNENLAISYGMLDHEKEQQGATAGIVMEMRGISAAYTMGAASVRMNHSTASNDGHVTGVDDEATELSLALSF